MNIQEARKIWDQHQEPKPYCNCGVKSGTPCHEAKGYLKCHEKAQEFSSLLERSISKIRILLEQTGHKYSDGENAGDLIKDMEDKLVQWEKEG